MAAPGPRSVPARISARVVRALRRRRPLWRFLDALCRAVENGGGRPYLVGGFVRDLADGRPGKDIDLMVAGMEFEELGRLLRSLPAKRLGIRRILSVGKSFAVYKVRTAWAEEDVDVALARSKRSTGPGRKPDLRAADADAREDAAHRDLTINSLLFALRVEKGRLTGTVVDFFGGLEDLRRRLIRGVGDPEERIREDPLRLLRAIRQKNERRGYTIEKGTWSAIRRAAPEQFRKIPGERVIGELLRSLSWNSSETVEDLRRAGILSILLPEAVAVDRRAERIRRRYAILEKSLGRPLPETPMLANLLADVAQSECDRRIRKAFPRSRRARVRVLAKEQERNLFRLPRTDGIVRRLHFPQVRNVVRILEDVARLTHIARTRNRNARIEAAFGRWETPDHLLALYRACCKTSGRTPSDFRPVLERAAGMPPVLSGNDLLRLGIPAGPRMERILEDVREATLTRRISTRQEGTDFALSIAGGETAARSRRHGLTRPEGKAVTPAGSPARTGQEAGRKEVPRRTPRRSPDRSG